MAASLGHRGSIFTNMAAMYSPDAGMMMDNAFLLNSRLLASLEHVLPKHEAIWVWPASKFKVTEAASPSFELDLHT